MALYLDRRWTTDPVVTWPYTFVAWDDFELPDDEHELFRALISIWEQARSGSLVEVACDGGTGRTGTALACLAILTGMEPADAIAWVRRNYHRWAVEVPDQEDLVARFKTWLAQQGRTPGT